MSVPVVLGTPVAPPAPPPAPRFTRLGLQWTGVDGSVWDLNRWSQGLIVTRDGLEGMHLPQFSDWTTELAGIDGQVYSGGVAKARVVEWPVYLYGDTSQAWLDMHRAWWASFRPRTGYGVWRVTAVDGTSRELSCRITSDGGFAYSLDPQRFGWSRYTVTLVADDPWWYGDPITETWSTPASVPFYDPNGSPPFHIGTSRTFASATLSNPGDEPAWIDWRFDATQGAIASAVVTIAGGTISTPAVAQGSVMTVTTDPASPLAMLNGTDVSGQMLQWGRSAIPPGQSVPINIVSSAQPGALITASFRPKYWSAF